MIKSEISLTSICDNTRVNVPWWGASGLAKNSGKRSWRFAQNMGRVIVLVVSREESMCSTKEIIPYNMSTSSAYFTFLGHYAFRDKHNPIDLDAILASIHLL